MPNRFSTHKLEPVGKRVVRKMQADERKAKLFYMRDTWKLARRRFLRRNPLCHDCKQGQRFVPATEVHHVVKVRDDWSKRLESDNLMALCASCHARRTRKGE